MRIVQVATNAGSERHIRDSAVQLGQVEPFASMFRRMYPELVTLAWALTGSRENAEDIAQDSMLALYRKWDDLSSIENPNAYVRRICVNLAASWIRRRTREARVMLRVARRQSVETSQPEESEVFWSEVRRLPKRQGQVVALFYGCDLSVEQVAETLEMAQGTVKVHLSRGRTTLADRMVVKAGSEGGV